jgi:adenosine deaminase
MERYKKIVSLNNEMEARIIEDLLTERNIPYRIKSYHDSAYDGLFQMQKGWGIVEAPEEYEDEIKRLYNTLPGEIIQENFPEGETE